MGFTPETHTALDTYPAAFTLTDSLVTPNGVIYANYKRA